MPYFTRLALLAFFAVAIPACGSKELHFADAAQALDQGQKSFAAGNEDDARTAYEFAASSGTPAEQKEALELLLDLALLPGGQEQLAEEAFAKLQAFGEISNEDLVHYANLAANRAKMASVAETIVDAAMAQDSSLAEALRGAENEIEALKQPPLPGKLKETGYGHD